MEQMNNDALNSFLLYLSEAGFTFQDMSSLEMDSTLCNFFDELLQVRAWEKNSNKEKDFQKF